MRGRHLFYSLETSNLGGAISLVLLPFPSLGGGRGRGGGGGALRSAVLGLGEGACIANDATRSDNVQAAMGTGVVLAKEREALVTAADFEGDRTGRLLTALAERWHPRQAARAFVHAGGDNSRSTDVAQMERAEAFSIGGPHATTSDTTDLGAGCPTV